MMINPVTGHNRVVAGVLLPTSHLASTDVSSQSRAAADTDNVGMLASTAAAPGRVLSQSYLQHKTQNYCTSPCSGPVMQ